jgi:hypothetical protein
MNVLRLRTNKEIKHLEVLILPRHLWLLNHPEMLVGGTHCT